MNATRMLARVAARNAAPARRPFSVLENMAAPVSNMPNTIADKRKIFTMNPELVGADNPTYLKGGEAMTCVYVATFLATMGGAQILRGLWNMSHGTGKNDE